MTNRALASIGKELAEAMQRTCIPVGKGIVGQVALTRTALLLDDVTTHEHYVNANPTSVPSWRFR